MRTYRVNDMFYSLQGEGRNTGRAAVFVRFAGCNLRCWFCDTSFDSYEPMTAQAIVDKIAILSSQPPNGSPLAAEPSASMAAPLPLIVLTGGEPTLQVDEAFVDLLHQHGYEVAMESNGTRPAPRNLDWLTVSPKQKAKGLSADSRQSAAPNAALPANSEACADSGRRQPDELKVVFDGETDPETFLAPYAAALSPSGAHASPLLFLQPCDTGDAHRNAAIVAACVAYIKQHPHWRLSLQTHKLINIA